MRKITYLALTIFFILLWFKLVNVKEAVLILIQGKKIIIILAVLVSLIAALLASLRMKVLFSQIANVSVYYIFSLAYISALVSTIFPIFLGGFFISYLIAQKIKTSFKKAFLIIFIDFIISLSITPILAVVAFVYYLQSNRISIKLMSLDIKMFIFAALFLIISILIINNLVKTRFQKYRGYLQKAYGLFLSSKILVVKSFSITIVVTILGFINRYLYFLAYDLNPDIKEFVLGISLFDLLNLIPGTPLKIGQYETFGVLTIPYLLDLDKTRVFAVFLVQHAISILVIVVIGLVSINLLKLDLSLIRRFRKKS